MKQHDEHSAAQPGKPEVLRSIAAGRAAMNIKADSATKKYFETLQARVDEQYKIAKSAREKGKDVSLEVECPPTLDLADRTENIIGPPGVAKRYRELYAQYRGCMVANAGCWQKRTDYQVKEGLMPTPGICLDINLKTRKLTENNFCTVEK